MVPGEIAKRLSIYVDESERYGGKPLHEALVDMFHEMRIAGVSVFRGVAGYGSDRLFHTSKMLALSENMPVKLEVVDSAKMIDKVLPHVERMVGKGLVEVSETRVLRCCRRDAAGGGEGGRGRSGS